MRAIGKNIILEEVIEDKKTESGLLMSSKDAEGFRYRRGRVLSPGSDVAVIKEGDEIYYEKGRSFKMSLEGKQVIVIQEAAVVVAL